MLVPEYDLNLPTIITEDEVSGDGAQRFRKELKRIAGRNPFGGQILELRWGVTYHDPMSVDKDTIKYLDFKQHDIQYGERRWFVEIWRSPQFLRRSGRYKILNDPDHVQEFYFCKACETEIKCDAQSLEMLGSVPACPKCGSTRSRTELIRETGTGKLLCDFPTEGCYDYWLRLERANLTYHPPDNEMLKVVRAVWQWEQMPQNKRDAIEQADREVERRQMILQERQQSGRAPQIGSGLITPAHFSAR